jgi:surfactin synthase thioesterase subunit
MGRRINEETLDTTIEVLTGEEDPRRSREEIRRLTEI